MVNINNKQLCKLPPHIFKLSQHLYNDDDEYKQASYFTLHRHTNNLQRSTYLSLPNIHHRKLNEMDYVFATLMLRLQV